MTTVLVSGDSYTSSYPLETKFGHRDFGWPNLVSNHFGWTLIDKSRAGSSNYRIYRKAFDGLVSTKTDMVLVFLTHFTRLETAANYGPKPGRIYQHQRADHELSEQAFRLYYNGYKNYTDMLRHVVSLQSLAKQLGKACYFCDTFDHNLRRNLDIEQFKAVLQTNLLAFENMDNDRIRQKFDTVTMLESQINWQTFISDRSFDCLVKDYAFVEDHPGIEAQRCMADIVIDFLQKNHYDGAHSR